MSEVKSLKFLVDIKTREEFAQWLEQFQNLSKTKYTIRCTEPVLGRSIIFKQRLVCQHNTRKEKIYDPTMPRKTKNTNCPSKISARIHVVRDRYRGKNKELIQLCKELPCEIYVVLEHNHSVESVASLRYRQPSTEVKEKLISLFNKGHSPATALDSIKMEIQLNYPDSYPLVLADRSRCPDYNFCYYLYTKTLKKKYESMDFKKEGKIFLQQMLENYNSKAGTECAKMVVNEDDYVICICSHLMQVVHKHVKTASKLVLMDSTWSMDHDGSKVFVLLTLSDCGGLPLGVIIASSESFELLEKGLQLLKEIMGRNIFGGNINGPIIFLTNDSQSEQNAIRRCFPNSKTLLCEFHVLQAVWRWLVKAKNGVPQQKQFDFFQCFKRIMFAQTKNEAWLNYEIAKAIIDENHQNYLTYLEGYWHRRDQWAISHRLVILVKGNTTNNISEAFMQIMRDKIFEMVKSFNVVQTVDFILTKVNLYFERRLLHAANMPGHKSFFRHIQGPPQEVLEKIKVVNEDIIMVPSKNKANHYYIVNMAVLICTCVQGNMGKMCKHIDWASTVLPSVNNSEAINNPRISRLCNLIATNEAQPECWLEPLLESQDEVVLNDGNVVEMEVEEEHSSALTQEELANKKSIDDENSEMLAEIQANLADFAKKSPEAMNKGLKRLLETLRKTKTPSECASLLAHFGEEKSPRNCKKTLVGCRFHPRGRPTSLNKGNMEGT